MINSTLSPGGGGFEAVPLRATFLVVALVEVQAAFPDEEPTIALFILT